MNTYNIFDSIAHSEMRWVEGGEFPLGHDVSCEVDDFWMGAYPISQMMWTKMGLVNSSRFQGEQLPVERVSWYEAIIFCNKLSEAMGLEKVYKIDRGKEDEHNLSKKDRLKWEVISDLSAPGYRLPSEAEWEYAARGGKYNQGFRYAGSNALGKVGVSEWLDGRQGHGETEEIDLRLPNELGLYAMSGNVYEWCEDWADDWREGAKLLRKDMQGGGRPKGEFKVLRGGCWFYLEEFCRTDKRHFLQADSRRSSLGFRIVRNA